MPSYWQLNKPELKQLAESRGLAVPPTAKRGSEPSKADYVRALEAAYHKPTRFFSLPPELRNMIYCGLLTFGDGKYTCYPQILRTSKEINKEASDVLYGANAVEIEITRDYVKVHAKMCGNFSSPTLIEYIDWPGFLRRAQRLHIKIAYPGPVTTPARVNHVFYSLCAHLAGRHDLTRLEVDVRSLKLDEGSQAYRQKIWPLTLLKCSQGMKAQLRYDKTVVIHSSLNTSIPGYQHRSHVLTKAVGLSKEARSYTELTKQPTPRYFESYYPSHWRPRPDTEDRQLENARSMLAALLGSKDFFDEARERLTINATEQLRKALAALNVNAVLEEQERLVKQALSSLTELKLQRENNKADQAEVRIRGDEAMQRRRAFEAAEESERVVR